MRSPRLVSSSALLALLATVPLAQQPLFSFAQISDSQPADAGDWDAFELVLDTIVDGGSSGALLPHDVAFVLFAGDLVDSNQVSQWNTWVSTMDARLTAHGIPLLAVPGNHDQNNGSIANYETFIGPSEPWQALSAELTGQNGPSVSTGWEGLCFIGLNNSNGSWNQVSSADRALVEDLAAAAAARQDNVFLLVHHPHNEGSRIPLLTALETPGVVGYMHGHSGSPHATHGLASVDNDDVWDLNTNAIYLDGGILYYEVFPNELHVHVVQLLDSPNLPPPVIVPLVHSMREVGSGGPGTGVRFEAVADAKVRSSAASTNYGHEPDIRVRVDSTTQWRSYLRFDLSSLGSVTIDSATLRLFCTESSLDAGAVYATSSSWSETGITWSNAPAASGPALVSTGDATNGQWRQLDVTSAVRAGTRNFVLINTTDDGAFYSSREGADPPELVVEVGGPSAVEIDEIVPSIVDVFVPGTAETLRIEGQGFASGSTVELDGAPLDPEDYTRVDSATITVDLPPSSVGAHTLRVRSGTQSDSALIQVQLPSTPLLQVGTGDPLNQIESGDPVPIVVSGPIGSRQVLLASTQNSPSTTPRIHLGIGAGFSDLATIDVLVIPASGLAEMTGTAQVSSTETVYLQALTLGASSPYPVSNVQSIRLVP